MMGILGAYADEVVSGTTIAQKFQAGTWPF